MAFASDGFSIREYTSKMRSVDVLKCWPFSITSSADVSKEDLKSCLPPMTVPKTRRRPDELEASRSGHDDRRKSEQQLSDGEISTSESESLKSEKSGGVEEERLVCPVCRVFNAATLTAVNAHIDGCLAQTMREERRQMKILSLKPKSKAPKKRSIAEIFEVEVEQPRIESLLKIWPFSKNPDEVSITLTKFRWWSRQLEAVRSNQSAVGESSRGKNELVKSDEGRDREEEKSELVCPVCGAFNAATVTAVNAHIDGCLAQAMREGKQRHTRMNFKPKAKAPKKRSISEILTVAPQIVAKCSDELIAIEEEPEEEEKSDDSSRPTAAFSTIHSKRNINKNKKKVERRWKKKLKKKRRAEKHSGGGTVTTLNYGLNAKKEDAYKRKVKIPAEISSKKLKGTIGNKRAALDGIKNASANEKKAGLKRAFVEKKQEAMENYSKYTVHQEGIEGKTCDVQEQILAGHVTFSNNLKRSSSDEIMFSSDEKAAPSVNEQSPASDETACLEVYDPVVESKQFSTTSERGFPIKFLRSCANSEKKKHLVEKSESLEEVAPDDKDNLHLFDRGNKTTIYSSAQSSILSAHQETRAGDSGDHGSPGKFMDHHGDSTHQVSATDSDASTRTLMQHYSLYHTLYDQGSEKSLFPPQTYGDNSLTLGYRSFSHMISANSSMDENFFGLPLNSQGELIDFSSCSNKGMNQSETSSMLSSSSRLLFDNNIACRSSHEYLSESHHLGQKTLSQDSLNKFPHYTTRLGVTELQGSGRAAIHQYNTYRGSNQFVYPLESESKPLKYPFAEQNPLDQVQNHQRKEMFPVKKGSDLSSESSTQPTMRLMGKDVPIGRSVKELQAQKSEEDLWAEQQYSRRLPSSGDAALGNSFLETCSKQDHLPDSPLQISCSVNTQSNQSLQSTRLMNGPEFESSQPFLDLQTNHIPQNGNRGFNKTTSCYYSHPITHAHPSGSASNKAPQDSPEQPVSGLKFQGLGSHFATSIYSQHTYQSNGDLFGKKKLPLVTNPAFEFPLVHPTSGEHAEASWLQSSHKSSPPWLLTHESNIGFPHTMWGGRFPTPVSHSVLNCSPVNYCHMTPISPASVVQPPLPRRPSMEPSSTIHSGCRNTTMINDRVNLEDKITTEHDLCNNTRRRPATNLHGWKKLMKFDNIEVVQENLDGGSCLIQENSSCEIGRTPRTVEVAPQGYSTRSKSCCLKEAQNIMSKSYLDLQISGPGRPSSPSIPVASTIDSDRDLDLQTKLTKTYKF